MVDLKLALRGFARNPSFAAVAVLTLALGIGGTTAIFSVVDAVVLRPLPYREPDRLVAVAKLREPGRKIPASQPELRDWRARSTSFTSLAGYAVRSHVVRAGNDSRRLPAATVTADFFDVLGLAPVLGRGFVAGEDSPGKSQVTVISYHLWQQLGGTPAVVGRTITVDDRPYTIVGVAPAGFRFPPRADDNQLWMPLPALPIDDEYREERQASYLRVVGRLAPGATLERAAAEMAAIGRQIAIEQPRDNAGMAVTVTSLHAFLVDDVRGALLLLLGAVGFVLLIACANVANLLLARASTRHRELAIRVALGAGRGRILSQLLVESMVLAVAGGALGVLLAVWGIDALSTLIPPEIRAIGDIALTGRVLAFSAGVSIATALVFGLAPAWQASSSDPAEALKEAGARATPHRGRQRLRSLLVVGEIAVATVLLVGAGLLGASFARVMGEDPGFDPRGLWTAHVPLTGAAYTEETSTRAAYQRLLDAVQANPRVEQAAVATAAPFLPIDGWCPLWRADRPRPVMKELASARFHGVSPGYFTTLRTPVVEGRDFAANDDRKDTRPVMVISRTAARRLFGDESPLGKRLFAGLGDQGAWEIIGVAGDIKGGTLEEEQAIEIYVPFLQLNYPVNLAALVRARPGVDVGVALRKAAAIADPAMPAPQVRPMSEAMGETLARRKLHTLLLGSFAACALLLALVGIYGVMSYTVTQQRHEIAIRLAIGATPSRVTRHVVVRGLVLALAGVAAGGAAAFALARLLESLLYRVSAADPRAFAVAAAVQVAVAVLAAWLPARRAARVQPMEALRS